MIRFMVDCMQGTRWVFQQGPVSTSDLLAQEYPGPGLGCKELVMGPALPDWGAGGGQSMWSCPAGPFEPPSLSSRFLSRAIVTARSNRSGAVFLSSQPIAITVM